MSKIFVANFPFAVTNEKLNELFSGVGTVISARVMMENDTGRSRGFGFVEMATKEEADKAIAQLDGYVWDGRPIKVTEDKNQRRHYDGPRPQLFGSEGSADGGEGRASGSSYFKAQPFSPDFRRRKKVDPFVEDSTLTIDYKDARLLRRFISERGKILPRRLTGLNSYHQRQVAKAIKRAQQIALLYAAES